MTTSSEKFSGCILRFSRSRLSVIHQFRRARPCPHDRRPLDLSIDTISINEVQVYTIKQKILKIYCHPFLSAVSMSVRQLMIGQKKKTTEQTDKK